MNNSKNEQQNSPPSKGGVSAGRGGCQVSNLESSENLSTTPAPPSQGGEFVGANLYSFGKVENPQTTDIVLKTSEKKSQTPTEQSQNKTKVHNLSHLKKYRKKLRNNLTPAEAKLWKYLQNKKLEGRKFRRQHSVGNYILDFYCPSEKLAIELDGQKHFDNFVRKNDFDRAVYLKEFGIRVLRFENKIVFEEMGWVLGVIKNNFGWNDSSNINSESK